MFAVYFETLGNNFIASTGASPPVWLVCHDFYTNKMRESKKTHILIEWSIKSSYFHKNRLSVTSHDIIVIKNIFFSLQIVHRNIWTHQIAATKKDFEEIIDWWQ